MAPRASSPLPNAGEIIVDVQSPPCRERPNALFVALERDDYGMVLKILDEDPAVAHTLCKGRKGAEMPLSHAVSCKCSVEIVQLLVKRGAMIDAVGSSALTPLAVVASSEVEKPGERSEMHWRTMTSPAADLPWRRNGASGGFLDTGIRPPDFVSEPIRYWQAKRASVKQDWQLKVGTLLLNHGADPLWKDKQGRTTFEQAAACGHAQLARKLEAWADQESVMFCRLAQHGGHCHSGRSILSLCDALLDHIADFIQPGCFAWKVKPRTTDVV